MNSFPLVGHHVIDRQHRVLFSLFYRCEAALKEENVDAVKIVVFDLIKYALEHFRYEEESMIHLKFNKKLFEEHAIQHALFKSKIIEISKRLDNLEGGLELLEFLRNWLVEHVMVIDQKFVDYHNSL
jgi:methyl-accepting chemotaxis protein/hemerythrin